MDSVRIDALASRCLCCCTLLGDAHRVIPAYRAESLLYARQEHELGLFVGDVRPMWRHVDCADPKLLRYAMRPDIQYCVRCRQALRAADAITPVMQVVDPKAVNPNDPTDTGLALGDRIHFVHVDCGDRTMMDKSPLLVRA